MLIIWQSNEFTRSSGMSISGQLIVLSEKVSNKVQVIEYSSSEKVCKRG